jgi:hypothetical protein
MMEDIFVSYSRKDVDRVEPLVNILRARGWEVWSDARIEVGKDFREAIERAISEIPCVLVVWSRYSVSSEWVRAEADVALKRKKLVPVNLDGVEVPLNHRGLQIANLVRWRGDDTHAELMRIINAIRGLVPELKSSEFDIKKARNTHVCAGVADRDLVFESPQALPNLPVFRAELLTRPIHMEKKSDGQIQVTIDRRDVKHAVYTTEGKSCLCNQVLKSSPVLEYAKDMDRKLHDFFTGRSDERKLVLHLDGLPLRWSSGGVLPIVKRPDSKGQIHDWSPFLFRDIAPGGWNIPLGASERSEELTEPLCMALREFLEETLVLPGNPGAPDSHDINPLRVFPFPNDRVVEQVDEFLDLQLHLRNQQDKLDLRRGDNAINMQPNMAPFHLVVIDPSGKKRMHPGMLICFNLLELGIECVPVFQFNLDPNHYLLDGEILKTRTGIEGEITSELVRMPIVLMSHVYLRRILEAPDCSLEYDTPEMFVLPGRRQSQSQASMRIQNDRGPEKDEIVLFDWDVRCRRALARPGIPGDPELKPVNKNEKMRAKSWMKNFERYFFDENGQPSCANHMEWFTPTSIKALSVYFATIGKL